jgi:hypothetical protein
MNELEALVEKSHPLGKYCETLAHRVGSARCGLSCYPGDDTAYLGFFECPDDAATAEELFAWGRQRAAERGCRQIVGPVDASFWLRYRMKLDTFDAAAYLGEPRNPAYYPRLWEEAGFEIIQRYSSSIYPVKPPEFRTAELQERLRLAWDRGFRVEPLNLREWDVVLPQVHALIMELYAAMPVFKTLSLADFQTVFSGLKRAADPELITLIWQRKELAAFSITLPDYGDLSNPLKLLWRKHHYRRVVAAYMGSTVPGLGSALAARLQQLAGAKRLAVVGALIAEGKPTGEYAKSEIIARRHYGLYRMKL